MPFIPRYTPLKKYQSKSTPKRNKEHDPFYDKSVWRKLRKLVLAEEPLCRECSKRDFYTPTDVIDHIIPRKLQPQLSLVRSNLQGLCNRCHAIKSGKESR